MNDRGGDPARAAAFEAWWDRICLQGDPMRRPGLVREAFAAGWGEQQRRANISPATAGLVQAVDDTIDTLERRDADLAALTKWLEDTTRPADRPSDIAEIMRNNRP